MIVSLLCSFMLVTQQPFAVMAFSLGMFPTLGEALCCFIFVANTECIIGLVYHLAVRGGVTTYDSHAIGHVMSLLPQFLYTTSNQKLEV